MHERYTAIVINIIIIIASMNDKKKGEGKNIDDNNRHQIYNFYIAKTIYC